MRTHLSSNLYLERYFTTYTGCRLMSPTSLGPGKYTLCTFSVRSPCTNNPVNLYTDVTHVLLFSRIRKGQPLKCLFTFIQLHNYIMVIFIIRTLIRTKSKLFKIRNVMHLIHATVTLIITINMYFGFGCWQLRPARVGPSAPNPKPKQSQGACQTEVLEW